MTCPRCHTEVGTATVCAGCGLRFVRKVSGFIKTSAVIIATREDDVFYGSLEDVPGPMRTRLEAATKSSNAGTILIADKGGRERILARAVMPEREQELTPIATVTDAPPQWALWVSLGGLVVAIVIILMVWGKWPNG